MAGRTPVASDGLTAAIDHPHRLALLDQFAHDCRANRPCSKDNVQFHEFFLLHIGASNLTFRCEKSLDERFEFQMFRISDEVHIVTKPRDLETVECLGIADNCLRILEQFEHDHAVYLCPADDTDVKHEGKVWITIRSNQFAQKCGDRRRQIAHRERRA